ncbi:unnamed protein product [Lactuca saligna]|uniref:Uncharacterized protein n=1 Tax=Lactuca saligna TaxID=75948 RepID=A0AA36E2D5_LACSI|nr:unnamed protein product [Lactuca saligna]
MVLLATKLEFLVYEILLSKGKPYKNNREILAMINLIAAYQGITLTLESSVTQPYQAIPQDKEPFHIEGMQTAFRYRSGGRAVKVFVVVDEVEEVNGAGEIGNQVVGNLCSYKGSNDPIGGT